MPCLRGEISHDNEARPRRQVPPGELGVRQQVQADPPR